MKTVVIVILILGCSLLLACSGQNGTGNTIAQISTLTIAVQGEEGMLLPEAAIYINNQYKGTTNKYGEGKGAQKVILEGRENWLTVEKEGYVSSEPLLISANTASEQRITIVLDKKKTDYHLRVKSKGTAIPEARVSLFEQNQSFPLRIESANAEGEVIFKQVPDGNYIVAVAKEGYELVRIEQEVNYSGQGEETWDAVNLQLLPQLEVRVMEALGRPLRNVEVSLYSKEQYNTPGTAYSISTEYTSREGKVVFTAVEYDESYVIVVKRQGYRAQTQEKSVTEEDQRLQFQLEVSGD